MAIILPKRICHISTLHNSNDNRIFRKECCSLAKAGYKVYLLAHDDKSYMKDGVHIRAHKRVSNIILRILFTNWAALFKALKIKADVYHYHDPDFLLFGFILRWLFRKKVVFDIHESVPRQIMAKPYIPKFARKTISVCYKIIEQILTIGQLLIVANKRSVADYPKKTYLVQNYPLLSEKLISAASEQYKRAKVPLLAYAGGVSMTRGAAVYVELAGRLAERGHDFRMKLIGWNCYNCAEKLTPRIRELGLEDKITFTGGMDWYDAMQATVPATIGLCLLLPIPNYTTCLATKIIEYMMLGIPVLASDFDVWRPYVEDERAGMMADPTNIDEVVEVCQRMLSDRDELVAMGRRGMKAVREKYNWPAEFKTLLQCYNDIWK